MVAPTSQSYFVTGSFVDIQYLHVSRVKWLEKQQSTTGKTHSVSNIDGEVVVSSV